MIKINLKKKIKPSSLLWGLVLFLSSIGLVSCDWFIMKEMYGTPHSDYTVSGKVKDSMNQGIKGIQTVVKVGYRYASAPGYAPDDTDFHPSRVDTVYTDSEGKFLFHSGEFDYNEFHLLFNDVDGEANGSFANDSIILKSEDFAKVKKGDKSWYGGAYEVEKDIVLKEK